MTDINMDQAYDLINNKLVAEMQPFFDAFKANHSDLNKLEVIEKIQRELSPLHAFSRLVIDYFYQVGNGGHTQYFGNGYHSSAQRGVMSDIVVEDDLFQKLKELALTMKDFLSCPEELDTLIKTIDYIAIEIDDDRYIEDDCEECNGQGIVNVENPDYDEDDEYGTEDEYISETCSECNGSGINDMATNYNHGDLTEECKKRCEESDDVIYSIDNKIVLAMAECLNKQQ